MDINELRLEIDKIDDQLLQLFAQRMEVSAQIGDYKMARNLPIYVPSREREKLQDVGQKAGPALANHAQVLYSLLFELSRSYQSERLGAKTALFNQIVTAIETTPKLFPKQAMIACHGQENSSMQLACERIFKTPCPLYFNNMEAVFSAVEQGMCKYGIVPLDNPQIYDYLVAHKCYIVRSFRMQKDGSGKRTGFACISKQLEIYPGADRTSIMMTLPHKPGALYRVLARLYVLGINVAKLESLPMPERDFACLFYFDLETSIYSEEFVHLMCELEDLCEEFNYLGSFTEVI